MIHNFRELNVWQKSMQLSYDLYRITKAFPNDELYGMVSQIRRAVTSIPANIAEGAGRSTDAELVHFLNIAEGSAFELETWLLLAEKASYVMPDSSQSLVERTQEIQRMIAGLRLKYNKNNK